MLRYSSIVQANHQLYPRLNSSASRAALRSQRATIALVEARTCLSCLGVCVDSAMVTSSDSKASRCMQEVAQVYTVYSLCPSGMTGKNSRRTKPQQSRVCGTRAFLALLHHLKAGSVCFVRREHEPVVREYYCILILETRNTMVKSMPLDHY